MLPSGYRADQSELITYGTHDCHMQTEKPAGDGQRPFRLQRGHWAQREQRDAESGHGEQSHRLRSSYRRTGHS